jgi:sec-independent protein translocase protein TatC
MRRGFPITDHLAELRTRIIRILLAWLVGSAAAWSYSDEIFRLLLAPAVHALGEGQPLQAIAPAEIFFSYVKCALLAGFLFSLPVVFWQVWSFVAPGLYPSEKNAILPFVDRLDRAVRRRRRVRLHADPADHVQVLHELRQRLGEVGVDDARGVQAHHEHVPRVRRRVRAARVRVPARGRGIVDAPTLFRGTRYAVLVIFIAAAVITPSPDWVSQSCSACRWWRST